MAEQLQSDVMQTNIEAPQTASDREFDDPDSGLVSLTGFPPTEERSRPDGAEEDEPDQSNRNSGDDGDDEEDDEENDEEYDSVPRMDTDRITSSQLLPWGVPKERARFPSNVNIETDIRPGEFVMRTLFAEFTIQAEKKISSVMSEPMERNLSKSLQRGEDPQFDQLLSAFGSVAEHCLPSILRTLFDWYERQGVEWVITDYKVGKGDSKGKSELSLARSEYEFVSEKRDLAVEFIFCLVLIEVLKQLSVHPGHEDLVQKIENLCFKHFRYRDTPTLGPNAANIHIIADLYAEVLGVLAHSRFLSTKKKFFAELRELRSREMTQHTIQSIISLLMGMKFFRVKMVPFEDFEHSFQFMHECAQYFLEVKDKDIKHAVAGLFVEILVPVAAAVKNEVNVPCLKNFVEKLYSQTLDMCTRNKHRLAIFPLVTCLLCVSQKAFFLHNWHYFLTMCLQHLKNRDTKMARVALESLYRLLWVYMIRIKCEANNITQSRLQSIVNSLFPKGSKAVVPRDTPLNIFVKIIQFIAQEKLDFAMREIVFDLLSVGRPIRVINAPERMSIGLRAFLVVADSLQQKEGEPPMPRTVGVMPSGSTLRVKKTFLNKMLTDETAKNIGLSSYYPYVRKVFDDILRALDTQFGRPFLMTNTTSASKEAPDDAKPKLDLFRTVIAAIPRLIPDGMSRNELVDTLSRLTVHNDEELQALACQGLQNLVIDFPDWREDVLYGFMQFVVKDIIDGQTTLLDNALRMLCQLLTTWKNNADKIPSKQTSNLDPTKHDPNKPDMATTLHMAEGFALVMLCHIRTPPRRLAFLILKEVKTLFKMLSALKNDEMTVLDALDKCGCDVARLALNMMPIQDKQVVQAASSLEFQWLIDRTSSQWTAGFNDDGVPRSGSTQHLFNSDPWSHCLIGFLHPDRLPSLCPSAVLHSWPTVHTRLTHLFTVVDPAPVTDNRASLLRPGTAPKKPLNEKDISMHLWKNYIIFACRVVPPNPSPIIRCVSPDLMLSSSPESLSMITDRSADNKSPSPLIQPSVMYKLLVPLLRCEVPDMRDSVINALGRINHNAIMDLMSELVNYIREAIDRKQENMRRRRRRDALRLALVRVFEIMAEETTFSRTAAVIDTDSGFLAGTFTDYIDGARIYLEAPEVGQSNTESVKEIKIHFASFIRQLIGSFNLEQRRNLLKKDLRRNLFYLFTSWAGKFGNPFEKSATTNSETNQTTSDFEFSSLRAMISVLCCGPCFDETAIAEDGSLYPFLDHLLEYKDAKVYQLAQETIVLLLEFNPDSSNILEWVVDRCFTGNNQVADGCFLALATIFTSREYPCDHYTSIINVTLMNTGCPRTQIHETALQLLQILDHRFFGCVSPLGSADDQDNDGAGRSTLNVLLSTTYSRSQLYLSRQLAQLHPALTMPMFSEICHRLQTARPSNIKCLLYYLLPWLYNMELVDPNVCAGAITETDTDKNISTGARGGWGTAEATEMIMNNLFYITVKFGDDHPKEVEELWAAICACWPKNLRIIIRYLFIISGLAPNELIDYSKRVLLYLGRSQPVKTLEEMMVELNTVETLNCSIERTETPPYYRLTSLRKASSNSEEKVHLTSSRQDLSASTSGTLHTKRHSQEDPNKDHSGNPHGPHHGAGSKSDMMGSLKNAGSMASSVMAAGIQRVGEKVRALSGSTAILTKQDLHAMHHHTGLNVPTTDDHIVTQNSVRSGSAEKTLGENQQENHKDLKHPHPLPMPEYGGWFAPLTEFLPDPSSPINTFHRCNLAAILLTDLVVDGLDLDCHSVDWNVHIPLMLHIIFLGLDNSRELVYKHCQQLLLNLLIVLGQHNDHLGISRILMNAKIDITNVGLSLPSLPVIKHNFTERNETDELNESEFLANEEFNNRDSASSVSEDDDASTTVPKVNFSDNADISDIEQANVGDVTKALIHFISTRNAQPFWQYEYITKSVWTIRSAEQIDQFLQHVVRVFEMSLPVNAHLASRWSELALQLALSCSSRHYAGRSLQIFRALKVPITTSMLSDILSRLVETIAEQGEDMQGYVSELFLTLEAVVDNLDSDLRPMSRDIFKSTPNLKDVSMTPANQRKLSPRALVGGQNMAEHEMRSVSPRLVETSSPIPAHPGHGYHASAPPMNPMSRFERSHTYNYQGRSRSPATHHNHQPPTSTAVAAVVASDDAGSTIRERSSTESEGNKIMSTSTTQNSLSRSRSAQSLKILDNQDDKMTILVQLFWICLAVLESDYEHEFLLGLRLLEKILQKLPLDRPDVREKVEKIQAQLKWPSFPGVHSLLLKGCTHPGTYEATIQALSRFTTILDFQVIDPTQELAFPMNVIALLPYMVQHYEDANELCIHSAENIAAVSSEKNKKLENLATVMTLYSRRTFSKESFQWTKCVVKYLHDLYSRYSFNMLGFLVEVLEKGPTSTQAPILTIIHCLLHYVDMTTATQTINGDLLRTVAKLVESPHWKESLRILKLAVTRSSTLVAPPSTGAMSYHWETTSASNFAEADMYFKKELPGRTMEFTFDLSQTPVIARKQIRPNMVVPPPSSASTSAASSVYGSYSVASTATLTSAMQAAASELSEKESVGRGTIGTIGTMASMTSTLRGGEDVAASTLSPKRSLSLTNADSSAFSGWKRPWMSQSTVRERLVTLLNTCGQRVGLPKSPSGDEINAKVIFSQTSELLERQSSMASSTEEVSGPNDVSTNSQQHDLTDTEQKYMPYMREFDFLEYELESLEGESVDNFNWGVRRQSISRLEGTEEAGEASLSSAMNSLSDMTPILSKRESRGGVGAEESSDDEMGSQISARSHEDNSGASSSISTTSSVMYPPNAMEPRRSSTPQSDTDLSDDDEDDDVSDHDLTPCNPSPNMPGYNWGLGRIPDQDDIEEGWRNHVQKVNDEANNQTILMSFVSFGKLFDELKSKTCVITQDSVVQLSREKSGNIFNPNLVTTITEQLQNLTDILSEDIVYPHVWVDLESARGGIKLIERLKFTILEIQENLDNFTDKKDFALECLDAIKTHQKLVSLGEQMTDYNMDNEPLDLVKCLYKLHFQLLLLLESFTKLLRLISQSNQDLVTDKSRELALIQAELRKAFKSASIEVMEAVPEVTEVMVEETTVVVNPDPVHERSPTPELDPTVESGVEDLNRIRIDDLEDGTTGLNDENSANEDRTATNAGTASKEAMASSSSSSDDSVNKSNESFSETLSADSSMEHAKKEDDNIKQPQESEQKIVDLITESKWIEAVQAYKIHKIRWPGTLPLANQIIGNATDEDDITAMLNLFCAALAEKSGGVFVMTLSDLDIAESYFKLQEAIQILSHTIKQLETFHFQKNKLKSSPIHSVTGVRAGQETEMPLTVAASIVAAAELSSSAPLIPPIMSVTQEETATSISPSPLVQDTGTVQEEADVTSDSATSNTTTPTNMDLEAAANNPPVWPTPVVPTILETVANNNPTVLPTPVPTILEAVAEEEIPHAEENEVVDEEITSSGHGEIEKNLETEEICETTTASATTSTSAVAATSTNLQEETSPAIIEDVNL